MCKYYNEYKSFRYNNTDIQYWEPNQASLQQQYQENKAQNALTDFPFWGKIWPSAIAISRHLVEYPQLIKNKHVLEIAAGLSLPSLVASQFAKEVICSDYDADAVAIAKQNIIINEISNAKAMTIDWRQIPTDIHYDFLIISDLNYEPVYFDALFTVLQQILNKDIPVLIATPQRLLAKNFVSKILPFVVDAKEYHIEEAEDDSESWIHVYLLKKISQN